MFSQSAFARTGQNLREKYKDPHHFATAKDVNLAPEQMLDVDASQLKNAKDGELMKGVRVRFIEDGPDRTIDFTTKYPKTETIEGVSAQQTVLELRQQIARQERVPVESINLHIMGQNGHVSDKAKLGEFYVDWMGFGLEDWPPRFISKPALKGWEVLVDVPGMRDTSTWDNGRMQNYFDRRLAFDVNDATTVQDLKVLVEKRLGIPAKQHRLEAHVRDSMHDFGEYIPLENSKTLGEYNLQKRCICIKFQKSMFDENGDFIFDDAFWDHEGYHPMPAETTWIPADSLCDRSRPDVNKVDPTQPLSIVSDRRQKENTDKEKAGG